MMKFETAMNHIPPSNKNTDSPQLVPCAIKRATRAEAPALIRLIACLAEYEHLDPPTAEAQERLIQDGFGEKPRFETWLAWVPESQEPVGYAFFFETYSSFLGRPTFFLEDIFVLPEYRHHGIGKALLRHCVQSAHDRGCGRMEWMCLDWNKKAQIVYEGMGAQRMSEWWLYRMNREKIAEYLQR
jgi:GNAT superfamily N-acetyltransferase